MKHAFVIAAGGSGAKTVEALTHLCAAGLGPDKLDILLLDVDQNNGNARRCQDTLALYQQLQRGGQWQCANDGVNTVNLFHTDITFHVLQEPVQLVRQGGLRLKLRNETGAQAVLDLLYDEAEQSSQCEKGFLARPNLGSLILGRHLSEAFARSDGGGASFKARLHSASSTNQDTPLIVVGSVFGGTGASLFPIACHCVWEAAQAAGGGQAWSHVRKVAVALLPYFYPKSKANADVKPARFSTDTASTLEHYETSGALGDYKDVYLVGSDDPARNPLEYCDGATDQANPCLLEELVAACAIINSLTDEQRPAQSFFALHPGTQDVGWSDLPLPVHDGVKRLAWFAHLNGFLLAVRKNGGPLKSGLLEFLREHGEELPVLPLYRQLLVPWLATLDGRSADKGRDGGWAQLADQGKLKEQSYPALLKQLSEYSWRFVLWANKAMPAAEGHSLMEFTAKDDYIAVWEALNAVTDKEIDSTSGKEVADNVLIRLVRGAACAISKVASGNIDTARLVDPLHTSVPKFPGRDAASNKCRIPVAKEDIQGLGEKHGLSKEIYGQYTKTASKN